MMILNNDDGDNDDNDEIDTASVVFADVVGDGACDYNSDNDEVRGYIFCISKEKSQYPNNLSAT